MIRCISGLVYRLVEAYAIDNLRRYLEAYIRSDFIKGVKIDSLFRSIVEQALHVGLSRGVDVDNLKEDLVDMFIDEGGGNKVLGLLLSHAQERGLSLGDSKVVVRGGKLTEELEGKVEEWSGEFTKMVFSYLNKFMKNRMLKWVAERKKEDPEEALGEGGEKTTEEGESEGEPEQLGYGVKDERELEEEMEREYGWEKGLIEDVERMLDREMGDDRKRVIYKAILRDRVLGKKRLEDMVKELGVSIGMLHNYEKDLRGRVEGYLREEKKLGPKFDLGTKEIQVPDYRVLLKDDRELQVDLKEWLKDEIPEVGSGTGPGVAGWTKEVLDLYAEGKETGSIAEEVGKGRQLVQNIKTRYFNRGYEGWYRDRVEHERKVAMNREIIRMAKEL